MLLSMVPEGQNSKAVDATHPMAQWSHGHAQGVWIDVVNGERGSYGVERGLAKGTLQRDME